MKELKSHLKRKLPRNGKNAKARRRIGIKKVAPPRLLASSKLDERSVRAIVRCFAFDVSPSDAMAQTGLSHVTVYRLYGHLRRRLFDLSIYKTFVEHRDALKDDESVARFMSVFTTKAHRGRGIREDARGDRFSAAMFRTNPTHTPIQLYRALLRSARVDGPLNRPMRQRPQ